jgi:calcineurin-like phosphoesterase family protein
MLTFTRTSRLLAALLVLVLLVPLVRLPESLAAPQPKLSLSPDHGQSGDTIQLTGWRFPPDTAGQVILTADDSVQGEFVTDADGRFVIDLALPALEPGRYTYEVITPGGELGRRAAPSIAFTIDQPPPTDTAIPPTAADTATATNTATATATPGSGNSQTLLAAGDIASCGSNGDEQTANLLDDQAGTVITLGDNAYDSGSTSEYANCYDPTWGRAKARTHPAPGNHEYNTAGATGYYGYFGAAAGDPETGYYSYDLGSWHLIALNSNCSAIGGCGAGSPQEQWLRADLAAHPTDCTLAYWHHPRFSSGEHGDSSNVQGLWQALYDYGAELVLVGHDHDYERFAPMNASGDADPTFGVREIVVGTGGRSHYAFGSTQPNSEVRNNTAWGILKLTLRSNSYDWQFLPVAGQTFSDSGSTACHGAPGGASAGGPVAGMTGRGVAAAPSAIRVVAYLAEGDRPRTAA